MPVASVGRSIQTQSTGYHATPRALKHPNTRTYTYTHTRTHTYAHRQKLTRPLPRLRPVSQVCKPLLLSGAIATGSFKPVVKRVGGGSSLGTTLVGVLIGVGVTALIVGVLCAIRGYQRREAARKGLYTFGAAPEPED